MERTEVYKLIDGERDYQQQCGPGQTHGAGAYLTYMCHQYREMERVDSTVSSDTSEHNLVAKSAMRKFAALAVACMEENGIVPREPMLCDLDWTAPKAKKASRELVYLMIDGERQYQEGGCNGQFNPTRRRHEFSEFLTMLRHYLRLADEAWTTKAGNVAALDVVRKLAGLAVRCMEIHGAPAREF